MNVDIRSTVFVIAIMAGIAAVVMGLRARNAIRTGRKLSFFFKQREQYELAARLILAAMALGLFAYASFRWEKGLHIATFHPPLPLRSHLR